MRPSARKKSAVRKKASSYTRSSLVCGCVHDLGANDIQFFFRVILPEAVEEAGGRDMSDERGVSACGAK